jgi:uncharacterized LabA/DUF88 family protein
MKKTAILIDGGFLRRKLPQNVTYQDQAKRIISFARNCIMPAEEEIYRIFYYDCPPYEGGRREHKHPFGVAARPMSQLKVQYMKKLLEKLRDEEQCSVRCGEMSFNGWIASDQAVSDILKSGRAFLPSDFRPNLQQKGVDLRIGVDITLMSKEHLVDRIILVAADSDFVPAMKLARREGVQIVLVSLGHGVKPLLREHADFHRKVVFSEN